MAKASKEEQEKIAKRFEKNGKRGTYKLNDKNALGLLKGARGLPSFQPQSIKSNLLGAALLPGQVKAPSHNPRMVNPMQMLIGGQGQSQPNQMQQQRPPPRFNFQQQPNIMPGFGFQQPQQGFGFQPVQQQVGFQPPGFQQPGFQPPGMQPPPQQQPGFQGQNPFNYN